MGYFEGYARQINAIAEKTFADYRDAKERFEKAEARKKDYPQIFGMTPEYMAKRDRAIAEAVLAKEDFEKAKISFQEDGLAAIEAARKSFLEDADAYFAANSKDIDTRVMDLLKTGILSSGEMAKLMNQALEEKNYTMSRVIATYAREQADKTSKAGDFASAREFYAVADSVSGGDRARLTGAVDLMIYAYGKTVQNPDMIDDWEYLTGDAAKTLSEF